MRLTVVGMVLCCTVASSLFGQQEDESPYPARNRSGDEPGQAMIYMLRSGSAQQLASTLKQFFEADSRVRVLSDASSNVLLIRVTPEAREEVTGILDKLDRQPQAVTVKLYLLRSTGQQDLRGQRATLSGPADVVLQRIQELESSGRLFVADRMELTTLENEQAMLQVGQRKPMVSGSSFTPRGRTNIYQDVDVGTLLSVTPRLMESDRVVLDLQFEKSELVVEADKATGQEEDEPTVPSVVTTTYETTVAMRSGQAVLVNGAASRAEDGAQEAESLLVVTASIRDGREPPSTAARRDRQPVRPRRSSAAGPRDADSRFLTYARVALRRFDTNENGVLEQEEWSKMSRDAIRADADRDGKITVDEYAQWLRSRISSGPRGDNSSSRSDAGQPSRYLTYAKALIKKYDTDGDGLLNAEEKSAMSRPPGPDADGDGDGKIAPEELLQWLLQRSPGSR